MKAVPHVAHSGTDNSDTSRQASPPPQQQLQQQHSFSSATLAPRPQPSAFTPILNEPLQEDEPEVIRYFIPLYNRVSLLTLLVTREWREKQAAEIKARDEASKERREQTIQNAMKSIDEFYEDYSAKKERSIRDNKSVTLHCCPPLSIFTISTGMRSANISKLSMHPSPPARPGTASPT